MTCQVRFVVRVTSWNEMTHLLACAERGQDDKADAPEIALKNPTNMQSLGEKSGERAGHASSRRGVSMER